MRNGNLNQFEFEINHAFSSLKRKEPPEMKEIAFRDSPLDTRSISHGTDN